MTFIAIFYCEAYTSARSLQQRGRFGVFVIEEVKTCFGE